MSEPLSYSISNWHQATKCLSNTSSKLRIQISDIHYGNKFSALQISVIHELLGVLFAVTVNSSGSMIQNDTLNHHHEFTTAEILEELHKFGFNIVYQSRCNLSADQLQYLITLQKLGFDKIRALNVYTDSSDRIIKNPLVVAFNVDKNPMWIYNTYECDECEFNHAMLCGSAINLSGVSETKTLSWDWLNYVANIEDVINDNINNM